MLSRFDRDGIELLIDTETGEAFATVNGYARMSGKDKSTISRRLSTAQGVALNGIKTAEIQTPGGLQGVALIPAKLVFEWSLTDNPELAKVMGYAGATVYLHTIAGYKVSSNAIATKDTQNLGLTSDQMAQLKMIERCARAVDDKEAIRRVLDVLLGKLAFGEIQQPQKQQERLVSYDDAFSMSFVITNREKDKVEWNVMMAYLSAVNSVMGVEDVGVNKIQKSLTQWLNSQGAKYITDTFIGNGYYFLGLVPNWL